MLGERLKYILESGNDLKVDNFLELSDISVGQIYASDVPVQTSIHDVTSGRKILVDGEQMYYDIMHRPIHRFVKVQKDKLRIVCICPSLSGMEINGLLHFAAPSKIFGFDTNDIRSDWTDLYDSNDRRQRERLDKHRRIPGWNQFENYRELILDHILGDYTRLVSGQNTNYSPKKITPVISLSLKPQENLGMSVDWVYSNLLTDNGNSFLTILGPLFAAAYSPSITRTWPLRHSYPNQDTKVYANDMGATQVLPLALWKAKDFLEKDGMIKRLIAKTSEQIIAELQQRQFTLSI